MSLKGLTMRSQRQAAYGLMKFTKWRRRLLAAGGCEKQLYAHEPEGWRWNRRRVAFLRLERVLDSGCSPLPFSLWNESSLAKPRSHFTLLIRIPFWWTENSTAQHTWSSKWDRDNKLFSWTGCYLSKQWFSLWYRYPLVPSFFESAFFWVKAA